MEQQPYMQDSKRDTNKKNWLLNSVGESEGGMIWENNMHITICEIDASPSSMHETRHSKLVHRDNSERWDEEGVGMSFGKEGHMYTCDWFISVLWQKNTTIL